MHPLFGLIASQPHRLLEHADAYANLARLELRIASGQWRARALLLAAGVSALLLALLLIGMALLLMALMPLAQMHAPWLLLAVPATPALIGVACLLCARLRKDSPAFEHLQRQLRADLTMLREATPP